MISLGASVRYAKLTSAGVSLIGLVLAVVGVSVVHSQCDDACNWLNHVWWYLALEVFALGFAGANECLQFTGKWDIPAYGFLITASMQLDGLAHKFLYGQDPDAFGKAAGTGFACMFAANIGLIACIGWERFACPVALGSVSGKTDDEEQQKIVGVEETAPRPLFWRNWALVRTVVGVCVGAIGVGGGVVAAIATREGCKETGCGREGYIWWALALEFVSLLGFVAFEPLLEMPKLRPVLSALLAVHIPHMAGTVDSALWDDVREWSWSFRKLQFTGFLVLTVVNLLIILFLQSGYVAQQQPHAPCAVLPTTTALVGFVLANVRDQPPSQWGGFVWWEFGLEAAVLIAVITSLCPKNAYTYRMRLPVVTLLAVTTVQPMVHVHSWIFGNAESCVNGCWVDPLNGVGYLTMCVGHFMLMLVIGGEFGCQWKCGGFCKGRGKDAERMEDVPEDAGTLMGKEVHSDRIIAVE